MLKKIPFREYYITLPSLVWQFFFFFIPTLIIFAYAFKATDVYGSTLEEWTLQTFWELINYNTAFVLWRTIWLSLLATLLCLLIALPMGYQLMSSTQRWRNALIMLVVVPFWSSFLIRIFAWKTVLHPEGLVQRVGVSLGLIAPETTLLYNVGCILFVMVYNFLPFAILPIFAAAAKFDFRLFEAAVDLGATRGQAFRKVFLPAINKGIVTAAIMVFIPAVGTYVIPDLVGGTNSELLGNKIAQKTFVERSLPQASALSTLLALATFLPVWIAYRTIGRGQSIESETRNRE